MYLDLTNHELKDTNCKLPCNYVSVAYTDIKERHSHDKDHGILELRFDQFTEKYESYFVYNFLSVIGDIGGYVGLFLGLSFYQLADLLEYITLKLK